MEIINGMKFVRVYNEDRYDRIRGIHNLRSEYFDNEEDAKFFAKYFSEMFDVKVIVAMGKGESFVRVPQMNVDRILSYYDKTKGCYMFRGDIQITRLNATNASVNYE